MIHYCHKCGAKLEENAKFCHVCGIPVNAVTSLPVTQGKRKSLFPPLSSSENSRLPMLRDRRLWSAAILTAAADFLVFAINVDSMLLPLRWLVAFAFSLVLPGYCLLGALALERELGIAETICLSVILSFGILALNGLLVNSMLGRIDLMPLMLFLSFEVLALMIMTAFRRQE